MKGQLCYSARVLKPTYHSSIVQRDGRLGKIGKVTTSETTRRSRTQKFTSLSGSESWILDWVLAQEVIEFRYKLSQFPKHEERAIFRPARAINNIITLFTDENDTRV